MLETYSFNSDGTADTLNFPGMADNATNTPGLIYAITGCTTNDKESFRVDRGNIIIPHAALGKPGLFTGLQDPDGAFYPGLLISGTFQDNVILPIYAKKIKDINGNVYFLSDLKYGSWQAATVAKCTLPDGTTLALKVHTEGEGEIMCFELTTNDYYSS